MFETVTPFTDADEPPFIVTESAFDLSSASLIVAIVEFDEPAFCCR